MECLYYTVTLYVTLALMVVIFTYLNFSLFVNCCQVRLQTMPQPEPGQKPMFTGTLDCALKTVRKEVRLTEPQ